MKSSCRYCRSDIVVKNGFVYGKQRWKCKSCLRSYREHDLREKYSLDKKLKVILMYLEGVGIRSIERLEHVPNPLIIKWIRKFSTILRARLNEVEIPEDAKQIQILELDELFSYCQKKLNPSTFGLLLIGSEVKLLISK